MNEIVDCFLVDHDLNIMISLNPVTDLVPNVRAMNEDVDGLRRELCSGARSRARVVRNTASAMNKGMFKLFTFSLSCNYTPIVLHGSVFLILVCYFYSRPPLIKLQDSAERDIGFLSK